MTLARLARVVRRLQRSGKRVVFTNGCFDIVHYGHAHYLQKARAKGDCLVVGLNSDASVRKLKGPARPVIGQHDRAHLLAALACVDYVVVFNDDTPYRTIATLKPDVLVKGADWAKDKIVGANLVKRVETVPLAKGRSTSSIIERIARSARTGGCCRA